MIFFKSERGEIWHIAKENLKRGPNISAFVSECGPIVVGKGKAVISDGPPRNESMICWNCAVKSLGRARLLLVNAHTGTVRASEGSQVIHYAKRGRTPCCEPWSLLTGEIERVEPNKVTCLKCRAHLLKDGFLTVAMKGEVESTGKSTTTKPISCSNIFAVYREPTQYEKPGNKIVKPAFVEAPNANQAFTNYKKEFPNLASHVTRIVELMPIAEFTPHTVTVMLPKEEKPPKEKMYNWRLECRDPGFPTTTKDFCSFFASPGMAVNNNSVAYCTLAGMTNGRATVLLHRLSGDLQGVDATYELCTPGDGSHSWEQVD